MLPESLYKLVPAIYIALGIYTWIKLEGVFAMLSGVLLVGAGTLVLLMRQSSRYEKRAYRIKQQQARERKR